MRKRDRRDYMMPFPCSSWANKAKTRFRFRENYGIHPTMHSYGHVYAEPDRGPYKQMILSEQIFEEDHTGKMFCWVDIELEWTPVPDWLTYCEIPGSIQA